MNLSEKITFHVYSAFAMKSNQNSQEFDQIRITAAIPSVYVVRHKIITTILQRFLVRFFLKCAKLEIYKDFT